MHYVIEYQMQSIEGWRFEAFKIKYLLDLNYNLGSFTMYLNISTIIQFQIFFFYIYIKSIFSLLQFWNRLLLISINIATIIISFFLLKFLFGEVILNRAWNLIVYLHLMCIDLFNYLSISDFKYPGKMLILILC